MHAVQPWFIAILVYYKKAVCCLIAPATFTYDGSSQLQNEISG